MNNGFHPLSIVLKSYYARRCSVGEEQRLIFQCIKYADLPADWRSSKNFFGTSTRLNGSNVYARGILISRQIKFR